MTEARIAAGAANDNDLTEADWAALDKLNEALKAGGMEALDKAQTKLHERDPSAWFNIIRTFFPDLARQKRTEHVLATALGKDESA